MNDRPKRRNQVGCDNLTLFSVSVRGCRKERRQRSKAAKGASPLGEWRGRAKGVGGQDLAGGLFDRQPLEFYRVVCCAIQAKHWCARYPSSSRSSRPNESLVFHASPSR